MWMTRKNLVLWDGACGFCQRSVEWFKRQDASHQFEFVPYQQAPSPPMTEELRRACAKAVHVVMPDGTVIRAGRAVLLLRRLRTRVEKRCAGVEKAKRKDEREQATRLKRIGHKSANSLTNAELELK